MRALKHLSIPPFAPLNTHSDSDTNFFQFGEIHFLTLSSHMIHTHHIFRTCNVHYTCPASSTFGTCTTRQYDALSSSKVAHTTSTIYPSEMMIKRKRQKRKDEGSSRSALLSPPLLTHYSAGFMLSMVLTKDIDYWNRIESQGIRACALLQRQSGKRRTCLSIESPATYGCRATAWTAWPVW